MAIATYLTGPIQVVIVFFWCGNGGFNFPLSTKCFKI